MPRQLLYILTLILLASCGTPKGKDIRFFEKYDFNSGDFKLYGLLTEGRPSTFSEKVGDFVISDTLTLNKIKRDWQFHLTDKRMSCGYNYIMILMKDDSCAYHFSINLDCEYLSCEKGWFEFPEDLLIKHENSATRLPRQFASAFHDTLISRHVFDK